MNVIKDNKLDLTVFAAALKTPALFDKSTARFWDDPYIASQMLTYHLDPDMAAASRTRETIEAEAAFIISRSGMKRGMRVLDLGCGPGLYVEKFAGTGADVTGLDLSENSIRYAVGQVAATHKNAHFITGSYLEMDYVDDFDVVTLIFYDFCALNPEEMHVLLDNVWRALKPGGLFLFDVITDNREPARESHISVWDAGLWSPEPYVEILQSSRYEEPRTEGLQYTIIDGFGAVRIIRIYHRLFGLEEIRPLLNDHRFDVLDVYEALSGGPVRDHAETLGIVVCKD